MEKNRKRQKDLLCERFLSVLGEKAHAIQERNIWNNVSSLFSTGTQKSDLVFLKEQSCA